MYKLYTYEYLSIILNKVIVTVYGEFSQVEILAEVLNSLKVDRASRNNNVNPVLMVTILVTISVIMSGLFASYIVGIFQDGIKPKDISISVINVARLESSGDRGVWNVYLNMLNRGETPLEIIHVELYVGNSEIYPSTASNLNILPPIVIRPGESRLVNLLIANHGNIINRSGDSLIFIGDAINEGMWITIKLIDNYGNKYYVSLQLPQNL